MKFRYLLFVTFSLAIICYSCRHKGGKFINQGEIHYNIDYTGDFGSLPVQALPQNLIVSFKHDKILFEMLGFGKSGILNLTNPEKNIFDTYFSFFTKKYYYAAEPGERFPGFEEMDGMTLKKTSKTSVICGFNCKNAEVTFPSDKNKKFDVWYTTEIDVKDPNLATPFDQIDGVLMSFFFIMGTAELHFNAETVYQKDIPDETFERKTDYVRVSRDDIDKFMNNMINF